MNYDPNAPYYGSTPEQLRELGIDPEEHEATRVANREYVAQKDAQQARSTEAQVLAAAQQAVAEGELSWSEAAFALQAGGFATAHAALVEDWHAEDAHWAAQEVADEMPYLTSQEYVALHTEREQRERERLAQQIDEASRQLRSALVTEMQKDLRDLVQSTPGVHALAPKIERQLVQDLQTTMASGGEMPSTPEERADAIETATRKHLVLSDAQESLRQQVDTEWRMHRKATGKSDGMMTAGDIGRAEKIFKENRFAQLADEKLIDTDSFKPGLTAAEESTALADKYREKQNKSASFHEAVGDIAKRGAVANAARDRGVGISEEKKSFREAMARAEAEAEYGTVTTTLNTPEPSTKPGGYGPDGSWPDELGPAI